MDGSIEHIGRRTIHATRGLRDTFSFALRVLSRMLNPRTYNSAVKGVVVTQFYFTAVQILPLFTLITVLSGVFLVGIGINLAKGLGFTDTLVRLIMAFVITEVVPLTTVVLITLRSGAAMNTEIAVMKVNGELRTLEMFDIDPVDYLCMPRVLTGMFTMLILCGFSTLLIMISGIVSSALIFGVAMDVQADQLIQALEVSDIAILTFKAVTLGFFVTLIPIWFGLQASRELTSIPVAVLNGMLKVFIAIVTIEVITLTTRFI
ncbi:MAG: ABC transporter permease [Smithellaceae bacterium]|nr:ABC transporter permease [Smithellaceae bacterium]